LGREHIFIGTAGLGSSNICERPGAVVDVIEIKEVLEKPDVFVVAMPMFGVDRRLAGFGRQIVPEVYVS
jgi:hypothetical protein